MKNIHIHPTTQPSRLYAKDGNYKLANSTIAIDWYISSVGYKPYNIYITSDVEIKEGDYCVNGNDIYGPYEDGDIATDKFIKIILTTDSQLIRYGVQAIDDEFLGWFVKNPTCEYAHIGFIAHSDIKEYKIIIPQEEPKQKNQDCIDDCFRVLNGKEPIYEKETLEEAAERAVKSGLFKDKTLFIAGAKWQAERMFSKEEVNEIISAVWVSCEDNEGETFTEVRKRILEQFKKK